MPVFEGLLSRRVAVPLPALLLGFVAVALAVWSAWSPVGPRATVTASAEDIEVESRGPSPRLAGSPAALPFGGDGIGARRDTDVPSAAPAPQVAPRDARALSQDSRRGAAPAPSRNEYVPGAAPGLRAGDLAAARPRAGMAPAQEKSTPVIKVQGYLIQGDSILEVPAGSESARARYRRSIDVATIP